MAVVDSWIGFKRSGRTFRSALLRITEASVGLDRLQGDNPSAGAARLGPAGRHSVAAPPSDDPPGAVVGELFRWSGREHA